MPNNTQKTTAGSSENTQFYILGSTLCISEERQMYNQLRSIYERLADASLREFQSLYSKNKGMDDVIKNAPDQAYRAMLPAIDTSVEMLVRYGIFTIDRETFFQNYVAPREMWSKAFQIVSDQYAEIVLDKEQQDNYRELCRENRGRWVGGGFGLSGAVKGAMTAGALNMASGVGHSIWNGLGRMASSHIANNKKRDLFNRINKEQLLHKILRNVVFDMHIGVAVCIADYGHDPVLIHGAVNDEDAAKLNAVLNNFNLIRSSADQKTALMSGFILNPYCRELYAVAYKYYGDANGELERLAAYFNIPTVVEKKKADIAAFMSGLDLSTEEKAIHAKKMLEKHIKDISFSGTCSELTAIDNKLKEFDNDARTVLGYTFSTREEAEANRSEQREICKILEQTNDKDMQSLQNAYSLMSGFTTKVARAYRRELEKVINQLDTDMRTVVVKLDTETSLLMATAEEAQVARQYVEELSYLIEKLQSKSFAVSRKIMFAQELLDAIRTDKRYLQIPAVVSLYEKYVESSYYAAKEQKVKLLESIKKRYESTKNEFEYRGRTFMGDDLLANSRIVQNAKASYMYGFGYVDGEKIVCLHDRTMRKNGELGFAITEKGIYFSDGFIPLEEIDFSKMKVQNGDFVFGEQTVKTHIIPFNISEIWNILETLPQNNIPIYVYLSQSDKDKVATYEKKKILYRIFGRYKDYYAAFENTLDVSKELTTSIRNGNVYNYNEIALYLDSVLEKYAIDELAQISVFQNSVNKKPSVHEKAISDYMPRAGFSLHEYPIMCYLSSSDVYGGFAITSRGVYFFSEEINTVHFCPLNKPLKVEYTNSTSQLMIGYISVDISLIHPNNRKDFADMVAFVCEKIPMVNAYALRRLDEQVKRGELTKNEYRERLTGFYFEKTPSTMRSAPSTTTGSVDAPKQQKCPQCGAIIKPDKKFCTQCGKHLGQEKRHLAMQRNACPKCGNVVGVGNNFCSKCGTKIQ